MVIALIDSGLNPRHEVFRDASEPWRTLAADVTIVGAGTRIEAGRLYAFPGTRLLGVTMTDGGLEDPVGHGSSTSGVAALAAPGAIIVVVQVAPDPCALALRYDCLLNDSLARGVEWAAEQPWIDIISISAGIPADAPARPEAFEDVQRLVAATRLASDSGKLVFNSAGNQPTYGLLDPFNGPPWVVSVGGVEGAPRGDELQAGRGVDVVANFTQYVPSPGSSNGYEWRAGTSFSVPLVAGVVAQALLEARSTTHGQSLEASELRDALNSSAIAWDALDWDPTEPVANDTWASLTLHAPVVAGPAQIGWGAVDHASGARILAALRGEERTLDPLVVAYMAEFQSTREAAWG